MDAVLQKSIDMTVELTTSGKSGRPGTIVAALRAERVSSIPVDHDNKNNNSVVIAGKKHKLNKKWMDNWNYSCSDRTNEFSDEDEEIEFSSGEYDPNNMGANGVGYGCKHDLRKYRKNDQTENEGDAEDGAICTNPVDSDSEFEHLKEKGSRTKMSQVSFGSLFFFQLIQIVSIIVQMLIMYFLFFSNEISNRKSFHFWNVSKCRKNWMEA